MKSVKLPIVQIMLLKRDKKRGKTFLLHFYFKHTSFTSHTNILIWLRVDAQGPGTTTVNQKKNNIFRSYQTGSLAVEIRLVFGLHWFSTPSIDRQGPKSIWRIFSEAFWTYPPRGLSVFFFGIKNFTFFFTHISYH